MTSPWRPWYNDLERDNHTVSRLTRALIESTTPHIRRAAAASLVWNEHSVNAYAAFQDGKEAIEINVNTADVWATARVYADPDVDGQNLLSFWSSKERHDTGAEPDATRACGPHTDNPSLFATQIVGALSFFMQPAPAKWHVELYVKLTVEVDACSSEEAAVIALAMDEPDMFTSALPDSQSREARGCRMKPRT